MPFGLTNAGETFQRAMDVAFSDLIDIIMVVYQDDLTTFSKKAEENCLHLKKVFTRGLEYGISLNPKNCHFVVTEGKLLGHIVSKDGVRIDPERVAAIDKIPIPKTIKAIQCFFGQINFFQRFISNFAKIVKPISRMLKKGVVIDYTNEALEAFVAIKRVIKAAPILKTPDFSKPFQSETTGRRCRWINKIQEFNIDIQITKLVRGTGLAKLMAEENLEVAQINTLFDSKDIICSLQRTPWYTEIIPFLIDSVYQGGFTESQKRTLKLQSQRYVFKAIDLYYRENDGFLLFCLEKEQAHLVLAEMHDGVCGGHFTTNTTTHKVLRAGYFWPSLFKDAHAYVRKCEPCQKFAEKLKYEGALPLRPMQVEAPFHQWGIDFIGEITEISSGGHKWILVATYYFTKWVEVVPTRQVTIKGNGQVESSNKSIMKIIKRTLEKKKMAWDSKFKMVLWADRITIKKGIGTSPFEIVYRSKSRMPVNNMMPVYKFIHENDLEMSDPLRERMEQLAELDGARNDAHKRNLKMQQRSKYLFDKRASKRKFKVNELVMLWNARVQDKGKHDKFEALWLGPFVIIERHGEDSYFLTNLNGEMQELPIHG
ncbi:uncharacterized protein LOC131875342 [Cryptomeria japonica]|uniref:uncharacterized protein LOC131875342 n=1 Tax=Cryptomeria japonica TaxID=3369 RepID=UPI0027DA8ED7|nr:uncharacterized protein LOC131875342 [Cryptomeria japonica]